MTVENREKNLKITRVERNVLTCIKYDGECLDKYNRLLFIYWTNIDKLMIYNEKTCKFEIAKHKINSLTSPESIDRAFRNLVKHKANFFRGDPDNGRRN